MHESTSPSPSALQELRTFVSADGHDLPPWSSAGELMEHVFGLVHGRRDDEAWLGRLGELVVGLRTSGALDGETSWRPLVDREYLDALIREIRQMHDLPSGQRGGFLGGLGLQAVLGLSAMTLAVGCAQVCDEATQDGIPAEHAEAYCELVDYIKAADIGDQMQDELLDCLPTMPSSRRDELVDLFATATEDEIADQLLELAGAYCGAAPGDDDTTAGDDDTGDDDTGDDDTWDDDDTGH